VLRAPEEASGREVTEQDFLQSGRCQAAAGRSQHVEPSPLGAPGSALHQGVLSRANRSSWGRL
jgi:hypothetical protein